MKVVFFISFFLLLVVHGDQMTTDDPEDETTRNAFPCGDAYWCPPGYNFVFGYRDFDCNSQAYPLANCLENGGLCVSNKTHPEAKNICNANCCKPERESPTYETYL